MCKKYSKLLFVGILALSGCSQGADEPADPNASGEKATVPVEIALSRAAADDFASAGVDKFTIFIYKADRKSSSLFMEKEIRVGDDGLVVEFPLGESYKTFAVANAGSVNDKETIENVSLTIDPASDRQVWLSSVSSFASDKSVASISLMMQRAVALVDFTPAETAAELSAQTDFDAIKLTFSATANTLMVNSGKTTNVDYTVTTDAAKGFKASFYTFDTRANGEEALLNIDFLKGGQSVNTSAGSLETGITFASNNHYTMTVPLLNNDFVTTPWSAGARSAEADRRVNVNITTLEQ